MSDAGRILREVACNVWAADRPFLWNGIDVGASTSAEAIVHLVHVLTMLVSPLAQHSIC